MNISFSLILTTTLRMTVPVMLASTGASYPDATITSEQQQDIAVKAIKNFLTKRAG